MEVLLFQIGIFIIISIAGYKGLIQLNVVTILIVIFTIVMVKTSPLMILQFFTIILSYSFSLNRIKKSKENLYRPSIAKPRKMSSAEIIIRLLINLSLLSFIAYGFYKFSVFYLGELDDMYILALISYLIILSVTFLICLYFYLRIIELAKELK